MNDDVKHRGAKRHKIWHMVLGGRVKLYDVSRHHLEGKGLIIFILN